MGVEMNGRGSEEWSWDTEQKGRQQGVGEGMEMSVGWW